MLLLALAWELASFLSNKVPRFVSVILVINQANIEAANLQNDKLEHLLKMYSYTRTRSSDNIMSDDAKRDEITDETHELEDAEQDELEEDDDDTDQNT